MDGLPELLVELGELASLRRWTTAEGNMICCVRLKGGGAARFLPPKCPLMSLWPTRTLLLKRRSNRYLPLRLGRPRRRAWALTDAPWDLVVPCTGTVQKAEPGVQQVPI